MRDDGKGDVEDSLLLELSSTIVRYPILFESEALAKKWHQEILQQQGFLDELVGQYLFVRTLAKSNFGTVVLSKHKNSNSMVVVKVIDKAKVAKTFTSLREPYTEIQVMKQACRG